MTTGRARRATLASALLVVPFLPFLFGARPAHGAGAAALLAAAAVGAPGAAGMLLGRGRGSARRFVHALTGAAVANVGAALALRVLGIAPGPAPFAAALAAWTVAGGAVGAARGGVVPDPRRHPVASVLAVVAFALAAVAGTAVVPPLEDQDSEVQGTAYGLAHDLEPLCLTNRSTLYFFAHPLLLHALNASTLTLAGELETVRPPHDAAVRARGRAGPREGGRLERAWDAWRGRARRSDHSIAWQRDVYGAFLRSPALTGTRAPNFLLAAAVAALLFAWARRLGAGSADAALLVVAYATLPEIFVRSGYGGYYAITAATLLASARLAAAEAGGGKSGYASGALAILSNQKALLVAAAAACVHGVRALGARRPAALASAAPLLAGMLAGGAAFWVYGLALAPEEFVVDHLLDHGLRRFSGGTVVTRAGEAMYASRAGIWAEFLAHFGWAWCAAAAAGAVLGVRELRARAILPAGVRREVGLLLAWVGIGALLFTVTDWRQTKHLCLLVPALALLVAPVFGRSVALRWTMRAALAVSIVWNAWWILRIVRDFEALVVTPVW